MNRLVIAGTSSGSGKTTISIGIMAALKKRGIKVAPFKVGPDYIDPGFHKFVTGTPSSNLDSWMLTEETVSYLFQKNMAGKDIAIVEGVMGLYDGYGTQKDQGSTAHIAKILRAPTILVIDGKAMSSSAAALALGYKLYDERLDIKGIIINKVSGQAHYEIIKKVIERDVGIECIGYLPSTLDVSLNSRHLGLIPAREVSSLEEKINKLVILLEECINLDRLLEISRTGDKLSEADNPFMLKTKVGRGLNIGVAKDKAFSFYYQDNLRLLEELGANLMYFSPLSDEKLPDNLHGIYLGGGFPEVFAKELEDNISFKTSLKEALHGGMPTYAECGGLMYLTCGIEDLEGVFYHMVGLFSAKAKMTKKLQRFGYVQLTTRNGIALKGHEFHRSILVHGRPIDYMYSIQKYRDERLVGQWECGLYNDNVLAGYPHIHFYSEPDFIITLLDKCKEYKKKQKPKSYA